MRFNWINPPSHFRLFAETAVAVANGNVSYADQGDSEVKVVVQ